MKTIPLTIPPSISSFAEKKVFNLFKGANIPDGGTVYHSLRLTEHLYKRLGELDFVVVGEYGLYVFEVKGGQVSRSEDGVWTFTDRFNRKNRKKESPFEQACSGMYSLLNSIERFIPDVKKRSVYGYGVIFPDITFSVNSVEWDQRYIIDASCCASVKSFEKGVMRLKKYWQEKTRLQRGFTKDELKLINNYLRPNFDVAITMSQKGEEIDAIITTLTTDQYNILDCLEENPRIICSGGAGTGKTFLALEGARRAAESGKSILVTCKSEILASYLNFNINNYPGITVSAVSNIPNEKYDGLIIDEGQDILNFESLSLIEAKLKGGFEHGFWRLFLDINNQRGLLGSFDPQALESLELLNPTKLCLNRNCRNTNPIIKDTVLLTACDIGVATAGDGPRVKYLFYENEEDGIRLLNEAIGRLLNDDVRLECISILSSKEYQDSMVRFLPIGLSNRITPILEGPSTKFPIAGITYSTISNYKGLENTFVIITELTAEHFEPQNINALYVSMTRAKAGLFLILPRTLEKVINKISLRNLERIPT